MTQIESSYERKMPPFLLRCVMGVFLYGVFRPTLRVLEYFGWIPRLAHRLGTRQHRSLAERNPFKGYVPASHDVFIATYPKSGTNWMMQIVQQLLWHGDAEFDHIHSVVPWPDTAAMGPLRGYAIPLDDPSVWRACPEGKRVIKTHFGWDLIPYSPGARYILVIRDPKDAFVSGYFFFVRNGFLGGGISVETWLEVFLSEGFSIWGGWAAATAGYWDQRDRENVLIVSFKSMKQDLRGTVARVAAFLGVEASDAIIDKVCHKSSFEYMKQIDSKFGMWKMIPWGPESEMIRSGRQGGSSELLSPAQRRRIDAHCRAELERLGSDFPYDEFCDVTPAEVAAPHATG